MLKEKILKRVSGSHAITVLKKLRKLLRFAIKWDLVKENAAEKVDLPRIQRKDKERLTLDQFMFLITNKDIPIRDRCVVALAGCAGLRSGETFALRWQDIDFVNNRIYVQKNFTGSIIKDVKTDKSHATLPMTEMLSNLLKKYRSECGFSYWVFPSVLKSNDKPLTPGTWTEKIWKEILNHYGLPQVGIHSLRHFFATFLLSLNIPAPIVQRFMRHSRISTTVDVYGHLSTADLLKAVKLMDESFKPFLHGTNMEQ
jgi:integrase